MDDKKIIKEIQNAYEVSSDKKTRFLRTICSPNVSLFRFINNQFKLINKKIYLSCVLYFLILMILLLSSNANQYPLLAAGIPFFSLLIVTVVNTSANYKMEELELVSLFSLKMVIMARLLIMTIITVLFIVAMSFVTSSIKDISLLQIICYFFIPYLLNMYINFKVMKSQRKEGIKYCLAISSVICLLTISINTYTPIKMLISNSVLYIVAFILLILTIKEIVNYLNRIEDYVWNLQ